TIDFDDGEGPKVYGSSWKVETHLPPNKRAYPVSGIFAFGHYAGGLPGYQEWNFLDEISQTPTRPLPADPDAYEYFWGTSFAAPQVAALASELYRRQPTSTWTQVQQRIIDTSIALPPNCNTLPPRIRYEEALSGW
ncbi:MAG: S8 family serine peptidase, partial [bacterium]|nr:S8 family serine peptidase [bacterium]